MTFGVSVLAHLLIWPMSAAVLSGGGDQRMPEPDGVMEVALMDPEQEPVDPDAIDRQMLDSEGKLVQLDRVTDERPPEVATNHLSEFDSRTAHETRAPNHRPHPGAHAVTGDRPDGQKGQSDSQSPNDNPLSPHALSLLPHEVAGSASAKDDNPEGRTSELPRAGGAAGGLRSAGSPGTREALMKSLGQSGSFDHLDDIDEGDENVLNSKRWKYASFFNRVRNSVANHWHPEVLHAARDPDGSVYGSKTRRTKLIISLNDDGSLDKIELEGASGVDYLDEEAIRAVRTAAPFANPPPGLADPKTGKIVFGFGFIFEIGGGARIFRYQR